MEKYTADRRGKFTGTTTWLLLTMCLCGMSLSTASFDLVIKAEKPTLTHSGIIFEAGPKKFALKHGTVDLARDVALYFDFVEKELKALFEVYEDLEALEPVYKEIKLMVQAVRSANSERAGKVEEKTQEEGVMNEKRAVVVVLSDETRKALDDMKTRSTHTEDEKILTAIAHFLLAPNFIEHIYSAIKPSDTKNYMKTLAKGTLDANLNHMATDASDDKLIPAFVAEGLSYQKMLEDRNNNPADLQMMLGAVQILSPTQTTQTTQKLFREILSSLMSINVTAQRRILATATTSFGTGRAEKGDRLLSTGKPRTGRRQQPAPGTPSTGQQPAAPSTGRQPAAPAKPPSTGRQQPAEKTPSTEPSTAAPAKPPAKQFALGTRTGRTALGTAAKRTQTNRKTNKFDDH